MNRMTKYLLVFVITFFGNVFYSCAQNRFLGDIKDTTVLVPISSGYSDEAYLVDAYGDGEDNAPTYLGYCVVEKNSEFDVSLLRGLLLQGLTLKESEEGIVSFSSFMPDVVVVFKYLDYETNVLFDFSHNLLLFYSAESGRDVFYDFSERRSAYLNAVIQIFPNDSFLREYTYYLC